MLNILYEDNHLIVLEKPAGILSQKDYRDEKSILEMIKDYLKEKYQKPGNVFVGLVHRLDRNTGGIMVFAKTSKAAQRLSNDIKNHDFNKKYYAIIEGKLANSKGRLINYLLKDENQNKSFVTDEDTGKEAILDYEIIKTKVINNKTYSLADITLLTGRHHQIRVQFSNLGNPLYGDSKYQAEFKSNDFLGLFAYSLSFYHPITKEFLTFEERPKRGFWELF